MKHLTVTCNIEYQHESYVVWLEITIVKLCFETYEDAYKSSINLVLFYLFLLINSNLCLFHNDEFNRRRLIT
jgi:hypothetical protein